MSKRRRSQRMAPDGTQVGFGFAGTTMGQRLRQALSAKPIPDFEDPRGAGLVVNGTRLEDFLLAADLGWVIALYAWLLGFDWADFTKAYRPSGRRPIHPRIIVGLVVYGALLGVQSLRELESLAKRDLGAWFICGGLQPDHSTIGKVLLRHVSLISAEFFEKATKGLLRGLQIEPGGKGAIDGTIIQAAASRFTMLTRDAAREATKQAQAEVEKLLAAQGSRPPAAGQETPAAAALAPTTDVAAKPEAPPTPAIAPEAMPVEAPPTPATAPEAAPVEAIPDDTKPAPGKAGPAGHQRDISPELAAAIERAKLAREVAEVAEARAAERAVKGRSAEKTYVAPGEPEAMLQALKRGGSAPAYKPSIAVHESGLIIAQKVHPSSETEVVSGLRDQYRQVLGGSLDVTLLDGNYHCEEILRLFVEAGEDVLCPGGHGETRGRKGANGLFGKSDFRFEEKIDAYRCPAGHVLARKCKNIDRDGRSLVTYEASKTDCATCPLRERCTKAAARTVGRYSGDELKEGMQLVFTQPAARKTFKLRTTLAERPLAVLKERQGLRRFRRRGQKKVAMEFALHCVAFNFRRARSLKLGRAVVFAIFGRAEGQPWRTLGIRLLLG